MPRRNDTRPSVAAHSGAHSDYTYRIIPQAPPLEPRELESEAATIEIMIVWGDLSVLRVEHLSPPRSFNIGEDPGTDFVIGAETLGHSQLPLVLHGAGTGAGAGAGAGETKVVVPRGASAQIERDGAPLELQAESLSDYFGARSFPLLTGTTIRIQLGDFLINVRSVAAARRIGVSSAAEPGWGRSRWTFASAAIHLAVLGLCYFLPPGSSALSMDRLDTESRLVKYAIDAQQTPPEDIPKWVDPGEADGGGGKRAEGPSGEAGKPNTPKTNKKAGIPGTSPQIQLTREEMKMIAGTAGIIGVLSASAVNTPSSPFGAAQAQGNDPSAAIGQLLGTDYGTSGGLGGLDMLGTGHGGGGDARAAIGLGGIGTRGRGGRDGDGDGDGDGYGTAAGAYRNHSARVPRIRAEQPDLVGSLSKETIRRYIGQHIAEVRYCYEAQMNTRPDLQGRVAIKFVISATGVVMSAAVAQSDVGSAQLEQCIASTVRRINFPAPEGGGLVIVTYPFVLSQTGD